MPANGFECAAYSSLGIAELQSPTFDMAECGCQPEGCEVSTFHVAGCLLKKIG